MAYRVFVSYSTKGIPTSVVRPKSATTANGASMFTTWVVPDACRFPLLNRGHADLSLTGELWLVCGFAQE